MNENIELSKDTEQAIALLLKLCEVIMQRYEIAWNERAFKDGYTQKEQDACIIESAEFLFEYLKDLEEEFGGGYIDLSSSRALRLISQSDLSDFNLRTLFYGYQVIIHKLVLLDSHRAARESFLKAQETQAQFTEKKEAA